MSKTCGSTKQLAVDPHNWKKNNLPLKYNNNWNRTRNDLAASSKIQTLVKMVMIRIEMKRDCIRLRITMLQRRKTFFMRIKLENQSQFGSPRKIHLSRKRSCAHHPAFSIRVSFDSKVIRKCEHNAGNPSIMGSFRRFSNFMEVEHYTR